LTDQRKIILLVFELSGLKARVMNGQKPASPFKRGKAPFVPSPTIPVLRPIMSAPSATRLRHARQRRAQLTIPDRARGAFQLL
jgi:hypothetical protein